MDSEKDDNTISDSTDNNTLSNQSIPKETEEKRMNIEEITKAIDENVELKAQLEAKFSNKEAVEELTVLKDAALSEVKGLLKEKVESETLVKIYKEQVKEAINDSLVAEKAIENVVAEQKNNYSSIVKALTALLVKDEVTVETEGKSSSELVEAINQILDSVNVAEVREKLFSLGKEADGKEISSDEAAIKDEDASKTEGEKVNKETVLTKEERAAAEYYLSLKSKRGRGIADSWLNQAMKTGKLGADFKIEIAVKNL
jgi:hypothetical protein